MRARVVYLFAVMITIVLGIGSRAYGDELPPFVVNHFGDALWAAMIYFGVRAMLVRRFLLQALQFSLVFCYAIECSQLYQAPWINSIRDTLLGGLILGQGFLYVDLVRYSIGALVAYLLDRILKKAE